MTGRYEVAIPVSSRRRRDRRAISLLLATVLLPGGLAAISEPHTAIAANQYADSRFAGMSSDGRYVLFDSSAANLSPGALDRHSDVFVRDRRSGSTRQISLTAAGRQPRGNSHAVEITDDGRYVLFTSSAAGLVRGDPGTSGDDQAFFMHDRASATTRRIPGGGAPTDPMMIALSADGQWLAFASWDALVGGDTNDVSDVFVRNVRTGATTRVSVSSTRAQGNGSSGFSESITGGMDMSSDGRFVTFYSNASNLVPGDNNDAADVFVHDRNTGRTDRVSVSSSRVEANGESLAPALSATGRYVTFTSFATNIDGGGGGGFLHDRVARTTRRIGSGGFWPGAVSKDGRFVVWSDSDSGESGDTNGHSDVFLRDMRTSQPQAASISPSGSWGNADSGLAQPVAVSDNGNHVAFASAASNLVPADVNAREDVFVRDGTSRRTSRVNITTSDKQAMAGYAFGRPVRTVSTPFYGRRATLFGILTQWNDPWVVAVNNTAIYAKPLTGGPTRRWTRGPFYGQRGTFLAEVGDRDPSCDVHTDECGLDDVIAVNKNGIYVRLSTRGRFGSTIKATSGAYYGSVTTAFADVNRDGIADAIAVNRRGIYVKTGTRTGTFAARTTKWTTGGFYGNAGTFFADVNGDGRADAIAVNRKGTTVRLSNGSGFLPNGPRATSLTSLGRDLRFADVDGNGSADAIRFGSKNVTVFPSNGRGFGRSTAWTRGPFYGNLENGVSIFYADRYSNVTPHAVVVNKSGITLRGAV